MKERRVSVSFLRIEQKGFGFVKERDAYIADRVTNIIWCCSVPRVILLLGECNIETSKEQYTDSERCK